MTKPPPGFNNSRRAAANQQRQFMRAFSGTGSSWLPVQRTLRPQILSAVFAPPRWKMKTAETPRAQS